MPGNFSYRFETLSTMKYAKWLEKIMNKAKTLIEKYCPNLLKVYIPSEEEWRKLDDKIDNREKCIIERKKWNRTVHYETNIFDLMEIWEKKIDDERKINFSGAILKFINERFENLSQLIPPHLHLSLKKTIMDLLENFDEMKSRYLNHLGELIALDKYLSSNIFKFISLEVKTHSGTSTDYYLKGEDKKDYKLEVMNVKFDSAKWSSVDDLIKYFGHKINEKIIKKKYKIEDFSDCIFSFIINIWGFNKFSILVNYESFFKDYSDFKKFPFIFCNLVEYEIRPNEFKFEYSTVANLIEKYKKGISYIEIL